MSSSRLEPNDWKPIAKVIVEAWHRKGFRKTEVSGYTGRGSSLISKIKNGRAPIRSRISNQLIDLLEFNRARLLLAIKVAGNGALYFDPACKNACIALLCFFEHMIDRLHTEGDCERRSVFAAFSKDTVERVAEQAGDNIAEQFTSFSPVYSRQVAHRLKPTCQRNLFSIRRRITPPTRSADAVCRCPCCHARTGLSRLAPRRTKRGLPSRLERQLDAVSELFEQHAQHLVAIDKGCDLGFRCSPQAREAGADPLTRLGLFAEQCADDLSPARPGPALADQHLVVTSLGAVLAVQERDVEAEMDLVTILGGGTGRIRRPGQRLRTADRQGGAPDPFEVRLSYQRRQFSEETCGIALAHPCS